MDTFDEDGLRSMCSDFLTRSLSLKCFVSKFLLKLQSDAIFQQHLHVSDELRGHLEENALGDTAGGAEPAQSSPAVDSPAAPSRVTSQSLEASQTFMATLRYDASQSSIGGVENFSAGRNNGSGGTCSSSQDFGRPASTTPHEATLEPVAAASAAAVAASSSMQTSSMLSSAVLPQFIQSLTPLGGSGSGSSKERAVEGCARNAASSFTSQDNGVVHAPQGHAPRLIPSHQLTAQSSDSIHSSHEQFLLVSSKDADQDIHKDQSDNRSDISGIILPLSDLKQLQQQQKAASALAKYQEFLRQQQQMPPPQVNQEVVDSTRRADVTMVSIGQQTSQQFQVSSCPPSSRQPLLLAAELHSAFLQSSDVAASEGPLPTEQRCDSSKTATYDTLTPASATNFNPTHAPDHAGTSLRSPPPISGDVLPPASSPTRSQSLSLNLNYFPTSPNAARTPASPIASRLPKVLPSGDGRVGFIVLPAGSHADAAAIAVPAYLATEAPNTGQCSNITKQSSRLNQDNSSSSNRIVENDISDAETQSSAISDDGQEETLVIPETPTGTPIQPYSTRIEDRGVAGAGSRSRRPIPLPMRLIDSTDAHQPSSSSKIDRASANASTSSGKTRNTLYAKIVALPTQPAESPAASSSAVRISSRGRTIRPKVKFDSLPHHNVVDRAETSSAHHSRAGGAALASAKIFRDESSSGHQSEDHDLRARPIAERSRAECSKSTNVVAVSAVENTSAMRARTRCNHTENSKCVEQNRLSSSVNPLTHHQPQRRHHHETNSIGGREPAAVDAASKSAVPLLELRSMSFIVTNVSSENTVDINKGQLDRMGTSKKVLVARAAALGMTAWTAVANVTSSAVLVVSCPTPPHLVVLCETVVSASTQMLVALALGITPLHSSWLSSCSCSNGSVPVISESFVLPLDAIIPKEYARLSLSHYRPACITPLPIERRVLSGRKLGYHAAGAGAARIATVLSFAGAVLISVENTSLALCECEYIIVESKDEAVTLGGNVVPFDWVIAVLCIGYVEPLASTFISAEQPQTPAALRSSRSALKRAHAVETVIIKETPCVSKRSRPDDFSPARGGRGRFNEAALGSLRRASPDTLFSGSPVSPSEKAASSKILESAKLKSAGRVRDAKAEGARLASHAVAPIPSCFTLFDPKSKAHLRFDENCTVTSKVYSKEPSSNCELHAVESDQHGPYPHRLLSAHKSFLSVGRDGSVSLVRKGAGGRILFKFVQSDSSRKSITYEIIHESGRFLSLNASGTVWTTESAVDATKWQLQPYDRRNKTR